MMLRVYVTLRLCPLRVYVPCAHTPHMYVLHMYVSLHLTIALYV